MFSIKKMSRYMLLFYYNNVDLNFIFQIFYNWYNN
jgi:hypothetical protein